MRLNMFLQRAGVGSRREAERLVAAGVVAVNGHKAGPTTPVAEGDSVTVSGRAVSLAGKPLPRLFLLYKPLDVLVTTSDPRGRRTIFDLPALKAPAWPAASPRVMSVGRLDVNSEGLLLLSSDGPLAQRLMHPDTGLERHYRIRLRGKLRPEQLEALAAGVTIDGVSYRGARFSAEEGHSGGANRWYRAVLTEGKNREIRKLMEHFGCSVNRLIRLRYGPFELQGLEPGEVAEVAPGKVRKLLADLARRRPPP